MTMPARFGGHVIEFRSESGRKLAGSALRRLWLALRLHKQRCCAVPTTHDLTACCVQKPAVRECYDLLRTQWESSCDQIRLVPLSECSNYSVQCLRCAWQCKARSFYKKHHHDFCALRQFSAARDILVHDTRLLSSLCFAKDGSWRSSFAGPQVMPLPVSCG